MDAIWWHILTYWGRRPLPYPASLQPFHGAWTSSASSSSVRRRLSAAVSSATSSSAISRRLPLRTVFICGSSSAPWPSSRLSSAISISACGAASSASSPSGISSATPSASAPLRTGTLLGCFYYPDYWILDITLGVLTAVGGGVIRDVLAGRIPGVLRKEVYATASLLGSIFLYGAVIPFEVPWKSAPSSPFPSPSPSAWWPSDCTSISQGSAAPTIGGRRAPLQIFPGP